MNTEPTNVGPNGVHHAELRLPDGNDQPVIDLRRASDPKLTGLWVLDLTAVGRHGHPLFEAISMDIQRGDLVALCGASPAERAAVAGVLTGVLGQHHCVLTGELMIDGQSGPAIPELASLADPTLVNDRQPWQRRIHALAIAAATGTPLIALAPGTEGLDPDHATAVAKAAATLAANGRMVVVSADRLESVPGATKCVDMGKSASSVVSDPM